MPDDLRNLSGFFRIALITLLPSSYKILKAFMISHGNRLYQFESFVLDAGGRILLKDGATVRLTPKAFETLLVLVQNAMQVVEKDQLLKEGWPDSFVEEGSLSRNIHELRKVLGDDSSESRYIETIPKRGYRFVAPVKVSVVDAGQVGLTGMEGDATVIEKHTFARVISKEFEEADAPVQPAPLTPVVGVEALGPAGVTRQRKKQSRQTAAVMAVLLLAVAIGVFIYLRRARTSLPPTLRAKSTLARLTNNNAMDGSPALSPDGSKIVFWSNRDGNYEIYVMNLR